MQAVLDSDERSELVVPSCWFKAEDNQKRLSLHAKVDPRAATQLEDQPLDRLSLEEPVRELAHSNRTVLRCEQIFVLLHNGVRVLRGELSLRLQDRLWRMRLLYAQASAGLHALGFMSDIETWARYMPVCSGVLRSFKHHTKRVPQRP